MSIKFPFGLVFYLAALAALAVPMVPEVVQACEPVRIPNEQALIERTALVVVGIPVQQVQEVPLTTLKPLPLDRMSENHKDELAYYSQKVQVIEVLQGPANSALKSAIQVGYTRLSTEAKQRISLCPGLAPTPLPPTKQILFLIPSSVKLGEFQLVGFQGESSYRLDASDRVLPSHKFFQGLTVSELQHKIHQLDLPQLPSMPSGASRVNKVEF